jgi:hypothetical protein
VGEDDEPLKRAAEDMRDIYANEIARLIASGEIPAVELVGSWERYSSDADDKRVPKLGAEPGEQDSLTPMGRCRRGGCRDDFDAHVSARKAR